MKRTILVCTVAVALEGMLAAADSNVEMTREILALERDAMDGWLQGNPDRALAISDPEITYFHVMTGGRLNGLPALRALYENYRGKPLFDSYDIIDPKVQANGDMAILTYIFVWRSGPATRRWNSTQVYQRKKEGWRVIHSHWSMTNPPPPAPQQ